MENDLLDKQKYVFGSLFLLSNKLQVIMDRELAIYDITAKQWFLTAVIEEFFEDPPTISEVAEAMGSTHQNVKQMALKLQKNKFLKIEKDARDRRISRLRFTDKSDAFWQKRQDESVKFLAELFSELSTEELNTMYIALNKLYNKILTIEARQK